MADDHAPVQDKPVPPRSVQKWHTYAGGTTVPDRYNAYSMNGDFGDYHISPIAGRSADSRIFGYALKFANTVMRTDLAHSGLWHDCGLFSSPQAAASHAHEHALKAEYSRPLEVERSL